MMCEHLDTEIIGVVDGDYYVVPPVEWCRTCGAIRMYPAKIQRRGESPLFEGWKRPNENPE